MCTFTLSTINAIDVGFVLHSQFPLVMFCAVSKSLLAKTCSAHVFRRMFRPVGIVGLPNVGKSTLFNALTKSELAEMANYPFCTINPNKADILSEFARFASPEFS